jgi:hypothetical protein
MEIPKTGMDRTNTRMERTNTKPVSKAIPYGNNKKDSSHDHRGNKGKDRTPAQKKGDKKRSKS